MSDNKTASWDAGRFTRTLAYFGVIPFIGNISWLQKILALNNNISEKKMPEVILVAGATGGVGKRVVQRLIARGYQVRSLVRDAKKAREILGNKTEIVEGDITIPETLTPAVMQNVKAVISCIGTRVQPVEGDTPNREKYYQGIKFYMPEVVDIPELVEYKGIQNLLLATRKQLTSIGIGGEKMLFDFTKTTQDLKDLWGAVDDIVMGGVSESTIRLVNNSAVFSGNVSTANSGGFVSVRTRNFDTPLDLSNYNAIDLRVIGDGKRYKFILRNETKWDSMAYCYSFDTVYNTPMTIRIPFDALIPVFRAKTLPNAAKFDPSQVYSIQLMLSKFEYDGALNPKFTPGLFQLQIEYIKALGGISYPQFIHVSSAGVTRPGRPGIKLEEEPPAVRLNDQLGGILTWKLRGEDAIRSSGIPYTIIRPCAMTEEAGNKNLIFDQGDNIRGRVSREDIAELCVQALTYPEACNLTFEVKQGDNDGGSQNWQELFASVKNDNLLASALLKA